MPPSTSEAQTNNETDKRYLFIYQQGDMRNAIRLEVNNRGISQWVPSEIGALATVSTSEFDFIASLFKTHLFGHPISATDDLPNRVETAVYFKISAGPGLAATIYVLQDDDAAIRVLNSVKTGCLQAKTPLSPDSNQNVCRALEYMTYRIQ